MMAAQQGSTRKEPAAPPPSWTAYGSKGAAHDLAGSDVPAFMRGARHACHNI